MKTKHHAETPSLSSVDPDELKRIVRDGLAAMKLCERADVVRALEVEMRRADLRMSAYLIPLGIPGSSPEDLTPTEIGHLVRFLRINVPTAMPSVERAMASFNFTAGTMDQARRRLAA